MQTPHQINEIEKALNLFSFDVSSAHRKMSPVPRHSRRPDEKAGQARLGGVLLLLYRRDNEFHLILTQRKDDLQSHAGQVSFPGGRNEESESLMATALREAQEEIGINPQMVSILGELSPIYIFPSDFEVHPFVGWYNNGKQPNFFPNHNEVAEIIEVPLAQLLDPANRKEEKWTIQGYELLVPFFLVKGHKVWGATAMMLSEFLERLRALNSDG